MINKCKSFIITPKYQTKNNERVLIFLNWLNRPYPLIDSLPVKLIIVFGFGIFVFIFLILYQPFGASEVEENQLFFLSGFGMSVSIGLSITLFIVPKLFPKIFVQENWQIKKEIIYLLFSFIIIAILNYYYNSTIGGQIAPQHSLFEFIGITISIGIFPIIILIFLIELVRNKKNTDRAIELSRNHKPEIESTNLEFTIVPETIRSKHLTLKLDDFLFAKSENNYSTFYYSKSGSLEKALVRISFKNVETQISDYDSLIRCHNRYIVNKSKIEEVKGNARSLYIQLKGYEEMIPISRNFEKEKLLN